MNNKLQFYLIFCLLFSGCQGPSQKGVLPEGAPSVIASPPDIPPPPSVEEVNPKEEKPTIPTSVEELPSPHESQGFPPS